MMYGDQKEVQCEVEDVVECVQDYQMLYSLVMMSDMEKMKVVKEVRFRDYD